MGKYRKKSLNQQTIIKHYNIVNNNYYINNEDKDNIQDKNSSSEKTINKDKDEIDILNEPNFFCQNIINLIYGICISINIYLVFIIVLIKNSIFDTNIYKDLMFCILLDIAFIINYFIAFRVSYYNYIYFLQSQRKNIVVLIQGLFTLCITSIIPTFFKTLNPAKNIETVIYNFIFIAMLFPVWVFFAELYFLVKNVDKYKKITKEDDKNKNDNEYKIDIIARIKATKYKNMKLISIGLEVLLLIIYNVKYINIIKINIINCIFNYVILIIILFILLMGLYTSFKK